MNFDTIIENYMPIAKPLSMAMQRQKKHTSIIIYKKKIVSIGQNIFKTHPKSIELGYKYGEMHSELDAFRKIPYNLRGKKLILLNVRFNFLIVNRCGTKNFLFLIIILQNRR